MTETNIRADLPTGESTYWDAKSHLVPKEISLFDEWKKKDEFLDLCRQEVGQFQKNLVGHKSQKAGVFFAEAFAFLMFCKLYEVDAIFESGTGRGTSTDIWARNFSGKIITCESNRKVHHAEVEERLSSFENVQLFFASSQGLLDRHVGKNKDLRIALFIDGPKDRHAVHLAKHLFRHENVILAGVHDVTNPVNKVRTGYGFMEKFDRHVLSTDEPSFRNEFGYLDASMRHWLYDESGELYEDLEYTERMHKRFPLGCGIGVALNPSRKAK